MAAGSPTQIIMAITLEDFEDLVFTYARTHGQPFIKWSERAKLRAFIGRELQQIMEEKKLLYDDNITFDTASTDNGVYNLMAADTYVSTARTALNGSTVYVQILQPEYVSIEDSVLLGPNGKPGFWSVADASKQLWYDFRTVADAQPQYAVLIPPYFMRLFPGPSATFDVTVAGWIQHFDIAEDGTADTKELWLDAGSVNGAAQAIAGSLCLVGAEGAGVQAAGALKQLGMDALTKAQGRAASLLQGQKIRGANYKRTVNLS